MTLFRTSDIIMVVLMLCTAFGIYEVKSEAQKRYQDVRLLERKIESEQDAAAVLRARWALATEPARLERLAAQYHDSLQLDSIQPRQIVQLSDIPPRLPDAIDLAIKDGEALTAQGGADKDGSGKALDMVATGSVKSGFGAGGNGGQKSQRLLAAPKSGTVKKPENQHKMPPWQNSKTMPQGVKD